METNVTDRIKSYEDACKELGITPIDESVLLASGFTKDEIVYRKIKTISEALNEGWKADWINEKEKKWIPYFYPASASGFVFTGTYYRYLCAYAGDGARLCFKTAALAEYAGRQFTELYKEFIM
jgi:hypothetical protein